MNKQVEVEGRQKWLDAANEVENTEQFLALYNHVISKDLDYDSAVWGATAVMWAALQIFNQNYGISGHQAGAIAWCLMEPLMGVKSPARVLEFALMLNPQTEYKFNTITPEVWEYLQNNAKELLSLNQGKLAPAQEEHLIDIVNGKVPFGYTIKADE